MKSTWIYQIVTTWNLNKTNFIFIGFCRGKESLYQTAGNVHEEEAHHSRCRSVQERATDARGGFCCLLWAQDPDLAPTLPACFTNEAMSGHPHPPHCRSCDSLVYRASSFPVYKHLSVQNEICHLGFNTAACETRLSEGFLFPSFMNLKKIQSLSKE